MHAGENIILKQFQKGALIMRHDLVVSTCVEINAEPSKVWNVLTTPEIIKEYLFGTETITNWICWQRNNIPREL